MCGIVGFISKDKNKKIIIKKMADKIKHRGPDGEGYYIDKYIALGHRRLAIIDKEGGVQPLYNENKNLVILFNGEIYNYKELKNELEKNGHTFISNSDTEVLVHAYEKWEKDMVNHLRGMFAFVIWDKKNKNLFMARDHFGIKPLYYTLVGDTFIFASEIKAILEYPNFNKVLNKDVLSSYLCFNFNPSSETFFKGVYSLDAGSYLNYKDGVIDKKRYFMLDFQEEDLSKEELMKGIKDTLKNSLEVHKMGSEKVGSFLSSGVDSSYIVSLSKVKDTFSVGYENPKYSENMEAYKLASKLKISNKSKIITMEEYMEAVPKVMYMSDEPLADPSLISLYFLSELASKDVKVVMSGEGADEFFGGYLNYLEESTNVWYMKIPYFMRKIASTLVSVLPPKRGLNFIYRRGAKLESYHIGLGEVFKSKEAKRLVNCGNQIKCSDITKEIYETCKNKSNLVKRQIIDFYFYLGKDFLHAVDRMTMSFGVEARTPYLDLEVYNVIRKLPDMYKINKTDTKILFREVAKEIIPTDAYKRKKLGFPVPLREWIREDKVYEEIKNTFNLSIAGEFFNQKYINKLLIEHKNKKKDNYKKVWTIYTFLKWYQVFFA